MNSPQKQQLDEILREMVESAERRDALKVRELNAKFNVLVKKYFHCMHTEQEVAYDNCRQSCLMSSQIPGLAEDAREKYDKLRGVRR